MLTLVGIVVVLYIITRLSAIFNEKKTDPITSALGILAALACIYVLYCLISGNIPFPAHLKNGP